MCGNVRSGSREECTWLTLSLIVKLSEGTWNNSELIIYQWKSPNSTEADPIDISLMYNKELSISQWKRGELFNKWCLINQLCGVGSPYSQFIAYIRINYGINFKNGI